MKHRTKAIPVILVLLIGISLIFSIPALAADPPTYIEAFPDANFRAAVLTILNAGGGSITITSPTSEADKAKMAALSELNVSGKDIASLTGIEYFTGLKELNCASNKLTVLNLTGLNALTYLNCNVNLLTALDLTAQRELTFVTCNTNGLTEIKVIGLNKLLNLGCGTNKLASLNLSGLTSLNALFCDNNLLTMLDVSALSNLELIWCYNNRLTGMDITNNTKLAELHCEGNYMLSPNDVKGWRERELLTVNSPLNLYYGTFRFYEQNPAVITDPKYNFTVSLLSNKTSLKVGETLVVDIMLSGNINYTQIAADISYDNSILEYAGYTHLRGWVASANALTPGKVSLRSMSSINMLVGEPCSLGINIATLKFTVKTSPANSASTALSFASTFVAPSAGFASATTAPSQPLAITVSKD